MRFWRRRKTIKEEERKTITEEERKTVQAGVEEDCFVRGGKEACKGRRKDNNKLWLKTMYLTSLCVLWEI